jgi:hypothetical protein
MAVGQRKQKGGRTARIESLVEPWVKAHILAQGVSVGDWITKHAQAERDVQAPTERTKEKPL